MSHFVTDDVDRIELGSGEWVEIKRKMSVGDYERIALESKSEELEGRIIPTLVVNIKNWNLKDHQGRELPVTRQNIERLDDEVAIALFMEIAKRNQPSKKAQALMKRSGPA